MPSIFQYSFMINAFIGGFLIAVLCSFISFFIVSRKISFIGVGISHSAFGGLAIGLFFGFSPMISALLFAIISGIAIVSFVEKKKIQEDSVIGILFSFSMALGIMLISLKKEYSANIFGYLFGNILSVTKEDLIMYGVLALIIIIILLFYLKEFIMLSFDETYGRVLGLNMDFYNYLLTIIIAVTIIISIKLVGIILISALLVIPAATTQIWLNDYKKIIPFSIILSVIVIFSGLYISFYTKVPSGALIVIIYTAVFFLSWILSKIKK
ncbi:MAG: metal ABC transporter permease [bacterium]|nr:metal ABC transporter permease [bacterium]